MLELDSTAPDFELPAENGEKFRLYSLKGKIVVLFFYPKDDTAGCTKEALAFSHLQSEFEESGIKVAGISPDSTEKHAKFKDKHDLKVLLLSDVERLVVESYGVWVEKSMYGKKYKGVEWTTFLINTDMKIANIWRKVKIPGHADAVYNSALKLL